MDSPGTWKNMCLQILLILQICHVIIYDDTDDGRDKTEDDAQDGDSDDGALGQRPET